LTKWKQIGSDFEQKVSITNRYKAIPKLHQRMKSRNVFHIASRELDHQKNLYWSIRFKGIPLLLEIKLAGSSCSAAMKSENIAYTKVAINAVKELLQT